MNSISLNLVKEKKNVNFKLNVGEKKMATINSALGHKK